MILAAHSYGEEEERKKKRDEDGEETGKGERVLAVLSVGVRRDFDLWPQKTLSNILRG